MQLARVLKRNPRAIAEELAGAPPPAGRGRDVQVAGGGLPELLPRPRGAFAAATARGAALLEGPAPARCPRVPGKVIIEHTNINPNKAAHIGHLRNAVLGDVLVRARCKSLGYPVEIQNYIDDTGVQLADVVVGFLDLRGMSARRGRGDPRALRLLLLGPLQRGRPLVRGGPGAPAPAPRDPPPARDRPGRARRDGAARGAAGRPPAPRDHAPARRRLRPADPRERHPGPPLLRHGVRAAEGERRRAAGEGGEERGLLGHAALPAARSSPGSRTRTRSSCAPTAR